MVVANCDIEHTTLSVDFYKSIHSPSPDTKVSLATFAGLIAGTGKHAKYSEAWRSRFELIRSGTLTDEQRKVEKAKLPAICASCLGGKTQAGFSKLTGLLQIDIDHLGTDAVEDAKAKLAKMPWVMLAARSPSGDGLKGLVPIQAVEGTREEMLEHVRRAQQELARKLAEIGLVQDPKIVRNPVQPLYITRDEAVHYNPQAQQMAVPERVEEPPQVVLVPKAVQVPAKLTVQVDDPPVENAAHGMDVAKQKVLARALGKIAKLKLGEKSTEIFRLGIWLGHLANGGLTFTDSEIKPLGVAISDKVKEQGGDTGKAETTFLAGFAKTCNDSAAKAADTAAVSKLLPRKKIKVAANADNPFCWWEISKQGEELSAEIDLLRLCEWLESEGYARYLLPGGTAWKLCRLEGNILDDREVVESEINAWTSAVVKKHTPEPDRSLVLGKIAELSRSKPLVTDSLLETLTAKAWPELRPPVGEIRFVFRDAVVVINGDIERIPIDEWTGLIPRSAMIERDLPEDWADHRAGDWARFARNTCTNPDSGVFDAERYRALEYGIGYLLDPHHQIDRAVCFSEATTGDSSEGRSGKGLLISAVEQVLGQGNTCTKDCKSETSLGHKNALAEVRSTTRLLRFEDTQRGFNFESIYNLVTDTFVAGKYGRESLTIPHDQAPKITITSNYPIKINSGSARARHFNVELERYYHAGHVPKDDFGERFFEWKSDDGWCCLFTWLATCAYTYLRNPEKPPRFESETWRTRQVKAIVPDEYQELYESRLASKLATLASFSVENSDFRAWEESGLSQKLKDVSGYRRLEMLTKLFPEWKIEAEMLRRGGRGLVFLPRPRLIHEKI